MHKWLLIPHALTILAFVSAFVYMNYVGSNRTSFDLNMGIAGYLCGGIALVSTLIALILFPYRAASTRDWVVLGAHGVGVLVVLALGTLWLGMHIA